MGPVESSALVFWRVGGDMQLFTPGHFLRGECPGDTDRNDGTAETNGLIARHSTTLVCLVFYMKISFDNE